MKLNTDKKIKNKIIIVFALYFICVSLLLFKSIDGCNFFEEEILFHSETSIFYKFTQLVVEKGYVPSFYREIQHPEGMRPYEDSPLLMEYVVGYSYNVYSFLSNNPVDLYAFIRIFQILFSSLSVIAVFLLSELIFKSRRGAVFSSLFYITSLAFFWMLIHPSGYKLDNFALPLIFFSVYFFFKSLVNKGRRYPVFSGILISIAMASWQIPQFFLLLILGYGCIKFIICKKFPEDLMNSFFLFLPFPILTGLFLPFIKEFYFSPFVLVSLTFVTSLFIAKRCKLVRYKRAVVFFTILSLVFAIAYTFEPEQYSHVHSLIYYKLKFFGQKPGDPLDLPFETRVYWTSIYNSPSLKIILQQFGFLFFAVAFPLLYVIKSFRKISMEKELLLYFSASFILLYLLMFRMHSVLVFFIVPFVAGYKRRFSKIFLIVLLLVQLFFYGALSITDECTTHEEKFKSLILNHTEPDSVILTEFHSFSTIFAYYNRSVNLHSVFENPLLRNKIKDFYFSLVSDEKTFYSFVKKVDADYFLYSKNMFSRTDDESIRYMTNTLQNFTRDSALFRFQTMRKDSEYFELVGNAEPFVLYRVK